MDVSRSNLGTKGAQFIAGALKNNSVLQKIDLSSNNIYDQGAIAIGGMLEKNQALQEVKLCRNWIRQNGATAIGKGLATNGLRLQVLDLSDNELGCAGAMGIAEGIEKNAVLQEL